MTPNPATTPSRRLVDLACLLADGDRPHHLCDLMGLDLDRTDSASRLHGDGTPIELCVTTTARRRRLRLIGDPGSHLVHEHAERLQVGLDGLARLLPACRATPLREHLLRFIPLLLDPRDPDPQLRSPGTLWLAAAVDTPGVGIYIDGDLTDAHRAWERARQALAAVLPPASPLLALLPLLAFAARPASLGIEGATLDDARVKLHFRLEQPIRLDRVGIPLLAHPALPGFLHLLDEKDLHRPPQLVFSIGAALRTGEILDVKLDACGCSGCFDLKNEDWPRLLDQAAETFGLMRPDLPAEVFTEHAEGAVLGLGVDCEETLRLNLYLKPRIQREKEARP